MTFIKTNRNLFIVLISFCAIYLLFPTRNSSIDAWGFASYIKEGDNLFLSHHLLYNAFGFIWVRFIGLFISVDALKLLITLNAFFAAATLYILGLTLKQLGVEGKRMLVWVAFAGSTWAIMRFATENETYIVPLFFSMIGSYFFVRSLNGDSSWNYFYSVFAALACLFHQVMFFWWLSIIIGIAFRKNLKPFLWYALPAAIVPVSYILVVVFYNHQDLTIDTLLRFVFRDYYTGAAGVSTGAGSLMFTTISIVRSFFQVHGYFALLPKISYLFIIAAAISIVLLTVGLFKIKQTIWDYKKVQELPVWVHLLAIIFQLIFAFLSSGNAEFMVMIPILLVIVLSQIIRNDVRFIGYISIGMLIWNISLGLFPLHRYNLDSNRAMSERVLESQQNNTKNLFVLFNKPAVENAVRYYTGIDPKNVITGTQYDDINKVRKRIRLALGNDSVVITNCINRPTTISRESLVVKTNEEDLFREFKMIKADSIKTLSGKYFIFVNEK